jgi:osmotically inducible protein OsmC
MHWPFVIFSGNTHTTLDCDPGAQRGKHEAVGIRLSALRGEDHEFIAAVPSPTAGQLVGDAWSACYITALGLAPSLKKVTLPPDFVGQTDPGWFLGAQFAVCIRGMAQDFVAAIVHLDPEICQ